jgi:hypothetical protein
MRPPPAFLQHMPMDHTHIDAYICIVPRLAPELCDCLYSLNFIYGEIVMYALCMYVCTYFRIKRRGQIFQPFFPHYLINNIDFLFL